MREIDDRTLLRRFYRDADDDALAEFIGRHRAWAVAKARECYAEEAEDVVQTSILRLMDSTPANGEVANPLGWWSVIISTAAMDALRRTMRRRRWERESLRLGEPVVVDVAESVARARLLDAVAAEIDVLEDQFRGPLLKRYFEDLSYREIAEALDCRPGTVASRLSRGIARLRDTLSAKGVLDLSSQDHGGEETMRDAVNGNRAFAARWRDVWIVHHSQGACGLGHISARLESDGSVLVRWRLDVGGGADFEDHPETAKWRLWFECDLVVTNAERFSWDSFRTAEGASPKAAETMARRGMTYDENVLIVPTDAGALSVRDGRGELTRITNEGSGPIVPDILGPLYVCGRPRDFEADWPVRFLGFGRTPAGRQWSVKPLVARYAGRKGRPQTGLNHAYELRGPGSVEKPYTIWAGDDGAFVSMGDQQETFVAAEDQERARAFIAARRP